MLTAKVNVNIEKISVACLIKGLIVFIYHVAGKGVDVACIVNKVSCNVAATTLYGNADVSIGKSKHIFVCNFLKAVLCVLKESKNVCNYGLIGNINGEECV